MSRSNLVKAIDNRISKVKDLQEHRFTANELLSAIEFIHGEPIANVKELLGILEHVAEELGNMYHDPKETRPETRQWYFDMSNMVFDLSESWFYRSRA